MNNNSHCLNCGQQLLGDFCHLCGQPNTNVNLTFTELLGDFFGDMLNYDSRFYRTLVPLLFRPGFLTVEFFKGRRIPYVPPLRLYLFISFILFLWLALVDTDMVNIGNPPRVSGEVSQQVDPAATNPDLPAWLSSTSEGLKRNLETIAQSPEGFISVLASRLPYVMFVFLPIFALILWLHFVLSGFNYLQHLVFALHFHAFAYLINLLFSISDQIISWDYALIVLLILNIYAALAMRRAFGSSVRGCILKTISILTCYLIALTIGMTVFFVVNVLNYG